jgi:heme/copper-type cytochrome/quinol oxidase subunit 2
MLLIIVPVIALTLFFAWRYRQSNKEATYTPDWDHSTQLELVIWGAPLLIIIALGAITWISTHTLDPYRRCAASTPSAPSPRTPSRWWSKWWRSTGSGCSSTPSRASPRSTSWPPRWTGRSSSRSRPPR